MSRAFIKESESEWLGNVEPEIHALERYLTRENGGRKIFEIKKEFSKKHGREVHVMNDGSSFSLDEDNRWSAV